MGITDLKYKRTLGFCAFPGRRLSCWGSCYFFYNRLLHGAVARLDLAPGSLVVVHVLFLKRLLNGAVARLDLAPRIIPYKGDALVRSFG